MSIRKIAEKAGVSISTVSRVLNDPGYKCSSETTRDRILKAAAELHYIPNEAARNLKKGTGAVSEKKISRINILVTRTEKAEIDPFYRELIRMIESEIHRNTCILSNIWYNPDFSVEHQGLDNKDELFIKEMFSGMQTKSHGLIIIGRCSRQVIKVLKSYCQNIVSVNRNSTNYEIDEVICDGRKIAATAVEYLIKLGHRNIGYIGDCHNEARYEGYRETLFKYGLNHDIDYVIETGISEEYGYKVMEKIMHQSNRPTGIYCANDIIAVGMLKCLKKYRSRYYQPSIISSDDIEESQYTNPMLTTIHLPKEEMAKFTLYLLMDRIANGHKSVTKLELEGSLVIRNSCLSVDNTIACEYYI